MRSEENGASLQASSKHYREKAQRTKRKKERRSILGNHSHNYQSKRGNDLKRDDIDHSNEKVRGKEVN